MPFWHLGSQCRLHYVGVRRLDRIAIVRVQKCCAGVRRSALECARIRWSMREGHEGTEVRRRMHKNPGEEGVKIFNRVHEYACMSAGGCKNMQQGAWVCRSVQNWAGNCTRVHEGLQMCTEVCHRVQAGVRICMKVQKWARGFKRVKEVQTACNCSMCHNDFDPVPSPALPIIIYYISRGSIFNLI